MDFQIAGKVAVVCASTAGIGLGVAKALASEGAKVVICGRRQALANELASGIDGAIGFGVDLTSAGGPNRLIDHVEMALGGPDILILNSGGPRPGSASQLSDDDLSSAIDLLVRPHRELVQRVLPSMVERQWGRIVSVGSSGVIAPLPNLAASNIGRAALAGYLKTLASEIAAKGITCNTVLPGRIDTDRARELDTSAAARAGIDVQAVQAASKASIPAGRYGLVEEFGAMVAFLCSQHAAYVTGTQIRVDGGMSRAY